MYNGANAFWDLPSKQRAKMAAHHRDSYFRERLYAARDSTHAFGGAFDTEAWGAYFRETGDWLSRIGSDARRFGFFNEFGEFSMGFHGPDIESVEAIGFSMMAPRSRFVNTRAAQTMRQATLSAMHNSVYSLRGALGNEASMLHR